MVYGYRIQDFQTGRKFVKLLAEIETILYEIPANQAFVSHINHRNHNAKVQFF